VSVDADQRDRRGDGCQMLRPVPGDQLRGHRARIAPDFWLLGRPCLVEPAVRTL
jgi:hypothetical protein